MPKGSNLRAHDHESAARNGAKGGSSPKKKATLEAKRIMRRLLESAPPMTGKMKDSLLTIGIDITDPALTDNAALISAVIISQALNGDKEAARMAFEMAGYQTTSKGYLDAERLELDRLRLQLERERMEMEKAAVSPDVEQKIDPLSAAFMELEGTGNVFAETETDPGISGQ